MKHNKFLLVTFALVSIFAIGYIYWANSRSLYHEDVNKKEISRRMLVTTPTPDYTNISTDSFILKTPGSVYNQGVYSKGSEFILGYGDGSLTVDLKVRVEEISKGLITLEKLEARQYDGTFVKYPYENKVIKIVDDGCYYPITLMMDVAYSYCFDIEVENNQMVVNYRLETESTMPTPN